MHTVFGLASAGFGRSLAALIFDGFFGGKKILILGRLVYVIRVWILELYPGFSTTKTVHYKSGNLGLDLGSTALNNNCSFSKEAIPSKQSLQTFDVKL